MVKAFWLRSANVGDVLTPEIVAHVAGVPCAYAESGRKWVGPGSTLQFVGDGDTVLGTGMFDALDWRRAGDVTWISVRGPRTLAFAGAPADTPTGDGGLLYPLVRPLALEPVYDIGVVPHYVDAAYVPALPANACLIPVSLSPSDFAAALVRCRKIVSSSLHGLVLAEAYGVPAVRACFGDSWSRIRAFDFKHADYYEGTGRDLPPALALAQAVDAEQPHLCPEYLGQYQAAVMRRGHALMQPGDGSGFQKL